MHWSADSQLLAIILTTSASSQAQHTSRGASRVQIWHRSNWHWYLKADKPFKAEACGVTAKWDEEQPLRLHLCSGIGGYRQVLRAFEAVCVYLFQFVLRLGLSACMKACM